MYSHTHYSHRQSGSHAAPFPMHFDGYGAALRGKLYGIVKDNDKHLSKPSVIPEKAEVPQIIFRFYPYFLLPRNPLHGTDCFF